jgi:WD40 repeat protein
VGTHIGLVHIWDTETKTLLRTFEGHNDRVTAITW